MPMGPYSFGTAFPYGAPKPTDYSQPLKEVSDLLSTIQAIKKQKYEKNLYQSIMDQLSQRDKTKGESAQKLAKAVELFQAGKYPEATTQLAEATKQQPIKIPEMMKERQEPAKPLTGGTLSQIGQRLGRIVTGLAGTILPIGKYTGPTTASEVALANSQIEYDQTKNNLDIFKIIASGIEKATKPKTQAELDKATAKENAIQRVLEVFQTGKYSTKPGEVMDIVNMDQFTGIIKKEGEKVGGLETDPRIQNIIKTGKITPASPGGTGKEWGFWSKNIPKPYSATLGTSGTKKSVTERFNELKKQGLAETDIYKKLAEEGY